MYIYSFHVHISTFTFPSICNCIKNMYEFVLHIYALSKLKMDLITQVTSSFSWACGGADSRTRASRFCWPLLVSTGGSMLISAVCCFFLFFGNSESAMIGWQCLFCGTSIAAWNALDVITVELYPTNQRSVLPGFHSRTCVYFFGQTPTSHRISHHIILVSIESTFQTCPGTTDFLSKMVTEVWTWAR